MQNRKEHLKQVFDDTIDYIENNDWLHNKTDESDYNSTVYDEEFIREHLKYLELARVDNYLNNVYVTKNTTLQAAKDLSRRYPNKKIGILNFASATNPGGGVDKGASAQEECICRCTNLYPCLNTLDNWFSFYKPHRYEKNPLHNDDVIYTPNILMCKTEEPEFKRLRENECIKFDVITCAAPNLREKPNNTYNQEGTNSAVMISDEELYNIHLQRAKAILYVAICNDIKCLVLGAFGCGAFRNNPYIVAKAYKEALKDYSNYFDEIEFAIYCRDYETTNYDAFDEVLG